MLKPSLIKTYLLTLTAATFTLQFSQTSFAESQQGGRLAGCEIVEHGSESDFEWDTLRLSPFWAQEMIGADLASEISAPANASLAIMDTGFDYGILPRSRISPALLSNPPVADRHGTSVANLIIGDTPYGSAAPAVLDAQLALLSLDSMDQFFLFLENLATNSSFPALFHASLGLNYEPSLAATLSKIASRTITVFASGNEYDEPELPQSISSYIADIISVGNVGPHGLPSYDSSEGDWVTISAPSFDMLRSVPSSTGEDQFGGTSAAAPLVTGAIARVAALLPGLAPQEAKILIERTALRSLISLEVPRKNGAGVINSYLLSHVALRLQTLGWPQSRNRIREDATLYDFRNESQTLAEQALRQLESSGCESKKQGFKNLRASYLLSQDLQVGQKLASLYSEMRYPLQGEIYRLQSIADLPHMEELLGAYEGVKVDQGIIRTAVALKRSGYTDPILDRILEKAKNLPGPWYEEYISLAIRQSGS